MVGLVGQSQAQTKARQVGELFSDYCWTGVNIVSIDGEDAPIYESVSPGNAVFRDQKLELLLSINSYEAIFPAFGLATDGVEKTLQTTENSEVKATLKFHFVSNRISSKPMLEGIFTVYSNELGQDKEIEFGFECEYRPRHNGTLIGN